MLWSPEAAGCNRRADPGQRLQSLCHVRPRQGEIAVLAISGHPHELSPDEFAQVLAGGRSSEQVLDLLGVPASSYGTRRVTAL